MPIADGYGHHTRHIAGILAPLLEPELELRAQRGQCPRDVVECVERRDCAPRPASKGLPTAERDGLGPLLHRFVIDAPRKPKHALCRVVRVRPVPRAKRVGDCLPRRGGEGICGGPKRYEQAPELPAKPAQLFHRDALEEALDRGGVWGYARLLVGLVRPCGELRKHFGGPHARCAREPSVEGVRHRLPCERDGCARRSAKDVRRVVVVGGRGPERALVHRAPQFVVGHSALPRVPGPHLRRGHRHRRLVGVPDPRSRDVRRRRELHARACPALAQELPCARGDVDVHLVDGRLLDNALGPEGLAEDVHHLAAVRAVLRWVARGPWS